jgi:hypothetical protein
MWMCTCIATSNVLIQYVEEAISICFSLGIRELVPAVPRKSLYPTRAPYTPVAVRTVIRLPADLSQE